MEQNNTRNKNFLLVVASGKATRMSKFTAEDTIPKICLSLGQTIVFDEIVKSVGKKDFDKTYVVLNSKHVQSFTNICLGNDIPMNDVEIITYDSANGTTNTISYAMHYIWSKLDDDIYNANVLITWSDIIAKVDKADDKYKYGYGQFNAITSLLNIKQSINDITKIHVVTDVNNVHRCNIDDSNVITVGDKDVTGGNVCGMYFVQNAFSGVATKEDGEYMTDFVSSLSKYKDEFCSDDFISFCKFASTSGKVAATVSKTSPINILDVGDAAKYMQATSNIDLSTRYFNKIEFDGEYVLKTALTPKAKDLQKKEKEFYLRMKQVPYYDHYVVGTIMNNSLNVLTMRNLKLEGYDTLYNVFCSYNDYNSRLEFAKLATNAMHIVSDTTANIAGQSAKDSEDFIVSALASELYFTTLKRLAVVKPLIDNGNIACVKQAAENEPLQLTTDYQQLLDMLKHVCMSLHTAHIKDRYLNVRHGDLHPQNIMFKSFDEIKCIDPRGYYGNSPLCSKEYDIAKFIYGITGYCAFTDSVLEPTDTTNGLIINDIISEHKCVNINDLVSVDDEVYAYVAIIWLKLSSYIINNPTKAYYAYCIGNAMLTSYYDNKRLNDSVMRMFC